MPSLSCPRQDIASDRGSDIAEQSGFLDLFAIDCRWVAAFHIWRTTPFRTTTFKPLRA